METICSLNESLYNAVQVQLELTDKSIVACDIHNEDIAYDSLTNYQKVIRDAYILKLTEEMLLRRKIYKLNLLRNSK